jgi:Cu/Zn superoxide dismutase
MILALILACAAERSAPEAAMGVAGAGAGATPVAGPGTTTAATRPLKAIADLEPKSGSRMDGTVTFTQMTTTTPRPGTTPGTPTPGTPGTAAPGAPTPGAPTPGAPTPGAPTPGAGTGGGATGGGHMGGGEGMGGMMGGPSGGGGMMGGAAGGGTTTTPGTGARPRAGAEPPVQVSIQLTNASPGNHAVFLHETGDCTAPDASSAGGYFAPAGTTGTTPGGAAGGGTGTGTTGIGTPRGSEPGTTPGATGGTPGGTAGTTPGATAGQPPGYLGFVTVGADGRGAKELTTTAYTLSPGPASITNRAVVVYEKAPDFTSAVTDPGARQACGVVHLEAPGALGRAGEPM